MKIVSFHQIEAVEKYPLYFQQNYAAFEQSKGWNLVLIADEAGAIIPLKTRQAKLVKQAQYLYPPVMNGLRLSPEEENIFLEKMLAFCKQQNICDFIMPPLHYSVFQAVPSGSLFTEMGIITVDLSKSEEEIFKAFSDNYRNEIRKALAAGVKVVFSNNRFPVFYELYKHTHQKQNIYFDPEREVSSMAASLGEKNCLVAVVEKDNEVYGAALVLWNAQEAYYYQSGGVDDCPYPGANKLLQLEVMKLLKQKGIKRYCMGGFRLGDVSGTKYEGIQKFKIRFGATVEKGFHFYSEITWRYKLYKTLLNIYLRLKGVQQNTTGMNYRWAN